jgi:hypothetical protein
VAGLTPARIGTIKPNQYGRLHVDVATDEEIGEQRGYQRRPQWPVIYGIRDALRKGSQMPPIAVAIRQWGPEKEREFWWVVDGQQRMWAAVDLNAPIPAYFYKTKSLDQERDLFTVLNSQQVPHANNLILSSSTQTARMLRAMSNGHEGTTLSGRVVFAYSGSHEKISAATLVRAAATCLGVARGKMPRMLGALDFRLPKDKPQLLDFWNLCGDVFTSGRAGHDQLIALASAVREHDYRMPSRRQIASIRRIKWERIVAATGQERQILMIRRINRAWPL